MHPPYNTILSLCEPIHYLPLHLHAFLEFEEERLEVQNMVQLLKVLQHVKQDESIAPKQRM
jgi:hypothetical protein